MTFTFIETHKYYPSRDYLQIQAGSLREAITKAKQIAREHNKVLVY